MVKIQLHQEGFVRTTGYQVVQRINRLPPGVTDPLTYTGLFVLRQTLGREAFDHVATILELTQLPINELKFFEALGVGGDVILAALPGDTLNVLTPVPHWIQSAAPYLDQTFIVDAVAILSSGVSPQLLPGGKLILPGYVFTQRDIGRWVTLSGFVTPSNNVNVRILSYEGTTATVSLTVLSPEIGGNWTIRRIRIVTNVSPVLELRYFPTIESRLAWEIRRGLVTVIASGAEGYTLREQPQAEFFRDSLMTTLESTSQSADDILLIVRNAVQNLQAQGDSIDTSFLAPVNYNFPP